MDELIDIVNSKGVPTGDSCMKSTAHQKGILHASVHIWFYTSQQEILIQKRSRQKNIYPNLWDVSVAGHIASGETAILSATREIKEEIGLNISKIDLQYQNIWEEKHHHQNGLIDHEIHHVFLAKLTTKLTSLIPQEEEVSDLRLMSLKEFEQKYNDPLFFVPHDVKYYQYILSLLKKVTQHEK